MELKRESMPAKEIKSATTSVPEEEPKVLAYHACEPAVSSTPVGISVELDEQKWLID